MTVYSEAKKRLYFLKDKYTLILIGLFLFHIAVKLYFTIPTPGPILFGDEYVYKDLAKSIYMRGHYYTKAFPPLYPILIAPAMFFRENFYIWIKIINVIISSFVIFPTWLIANIYLDKKKSIYCVILSALLPYHFIFPRMVMSENLFYPILLTTIYAIMKSSKILNIRWSLLSGILISFCLLTRYMFLVVIPVLIIFWWWTVFDTSRKYNTIENSMYFKKAVKHFLLITTLAIIVYLPWLYIGISNGWAFREILGLTITKGYISNNPITIDGLIMWICLYIFYWVLMCAPVINLVIALPFIWKEEVFSKEQKSFYLLTVFLTIILAFASLRHSWLAGYNYPIPQYILGRYITYVNILWIISAFTITNSLANKSNTKTKVIVLISTLTSILLFIISYKGLIEGSIWNLSNSFILEFNGIDAYAYNNIGFTLILYICFSIITLSIVLNYKPLKLNLSLFVLLLCFNLVSSNAVYRNFILVQNKAIYGKLVANKVLQHYKPHKSTQEEIIIYNDIADVSNDFIAISLGFWDYGKSKNVYFGSLRDNPDEMIIPLDNVNINIKNLDSTPINSDMKELIFTTRDFYASELERYEIDGSVLRVYELPIKSSKQIAIKNLYPNKIAKGQTFNLQDGDMSAITIEGQDFLEGSTVYFNGTPLETAYANDKLLTALVPSHMLSTTKEIEIQVKYFNLIKSNKVDIEVIDEIYINKIYPGKITIGQIFNESNGISTIMVEGKNFVNGSKVHFNGIELETAYGGENLLTATVPYEAYSKGGKVQLQVKCGEIESNKVNIEVIDKITIDRVYPERIAVGQIFNAFNGMSTIIIEGKNFVNGSKVRFNGIELETAYGGENLLTATVPYEAYSKGGKVQLQVKCGEIESNKVIIEVVGQMSIASIYPEKIIVDQAFNIFNNISTVVVEGKNFVDGSKIYFNGRELETSYGGENLLTAIVPKDIYSKSGKVQLQVKCGKVESNKLLIDINEPE